MFRRWFLEWPDVFSVAKSWWNFLLRPENWINLRLLSSTKLTLNFISARQRVERTTRRHQAAQSRRLCGEEGATSNLQSLRSPPSGHKKVWVPESSLICLPLDIKSQRTGSGSHYSLWEKCRTAVHFFWTQWFSEPAPRLRRRSKPRPLTLDVLWYMRSNLKMPNFSPIYVNVYMLTYMP